jgi:hypothetical protein
MNQVQEKVTLPKLAEKLNLNTGELITKLIAQGYLKLTGDCHKLTDKGKKAGGEFKYGERYNAYSLWSSDMNLA